MSARPTPTWSLGEALAGALRANANAAVASNARANVPHVRWAVAISLNLSVGGKWCAGSLGVRFTCEHRNRGKAKHAIQLRIGTQDRQRRRARPRDTGVGTRGARVPRLRFDLA